MDKDTKQVRRTELQVATALFMQHQSNLAAVARECNVTRQEAWNWYKGNNVPSEMTAWRIVFSKSASENTRRWANEVLDIYGQWEGPSREYSLTEEVLNNLR